MTLWLWAGFLALIGFMLWLDLGVINRGAERIGARRALIWTCICIALALAFNVLVYFMYKHHWLGIGVRIGDDLTGEEASEQFLAGWLVEYALSLDNILVIAVIFRSFAVPAELHHRVLFWGILGALAMRGIMIGAGTSLIRMFGWAEYLFGAVLLIGAARMLLAGNSEPRPESSWIVRSARRVLTVSPGYEGAHFFTRTAGRRAITPLFLVLIVIEATDALFALDSIPAVLGITRDTFLVFTSNVFAIMGLRSMYFALAAAIDRFRYVKTSLVFVLAFVGLKMLGGRWFTVPTSVSLTTIGVMLGTGFAASVIGARMHSPSDRPGDLAPAGELAWRRARRVVILVLGLTTIFILAPLTGLLPGPGGIPVAIAGLALLATEFVWARKLLHELKQRTDRLRATADAFVGESPRLWPVVLLILALAGAILSLVWWQPHWWPLIMLGASGPALAIGYLAVATFRKRASRPQDRVSPEGRLPSPSGPD